MDSDSVWPTYLEEPGRNPSEEEEVARTSPSELWRINPHRGFATSPAVSGEALISVSTNRMVQALSMDNGEIFWEYRKSGPLTTPPIIAEQRIFVATSDVEGEVYALRLRDGRERWEKDGPGVAVPMVADGQRLVLANVAGQVRALMMENGNTVWRTRVGQVASAPVLAGDRILISTDADSLLALDRESGRVVDRRELSSQVSATPAYRGGRAYIPLHGGEVVALRTSDLAEAWRVRPDAPVLAAPVVSRDGRVYLLDRTGGVSVVSQDGELRRLTGFGRAARGSLTLTSSVLLVGLLDGTFAAIDRESGELLWSLDLKDSLFSPAVVRGGAIYVPLRRGELVKLR